MLYIAVKCIFCENIFCVAKMRIYFMEQTKEVVEAPKRPRGRPKKPNRLMTREQWKEESKKVSGRPKGMRTAIAKLEERLLSGNRIEGVIDSIVNAASDPEHKNQAAAWKLIMDRLAPLSHYDKNKGGERPQIQINVSGINGIKTEGINSEGIKTEKVIEGVVEPYSEGGVIENNTGC